MKMLDITFVGKSTSSVPFSSFKCWNLIEENVEDFLVQSIGSLIFDPVESSVQSSFLDTLKESNHENA
jgi:hypothetical protein